MAGHKTNAQKRAEDRVLQIVSGAGRSSARRDEDAGNVYHQLLSEASDPSKLEGPPAKRRRVSGGTRPQPVDTDDDRPSSASEAIAQNQTIEVSDGSDESDFEWEDAGLAESAADAQDDSLSIDGVSIEVANGSTTPRRARRKGQTTADRKLAVATHQTHLLCLMFHTHVRNAWCNLKPVESHLRRVLSARIIGYLNPDPEMVQIRQADSFSDGLKLAVDVWRSKFKITATGMRKAQWAHSPDDLDELRSKNQADTESLTKEEFILRSKTLRGSQDLGNTLFCAMLRAVGVEARLVCSLQTLPTSMSGQTNKVNTPRSQKVQKPRIYATFETEQDTTSTDEDYSKAPAPRNRTRLGQPNLGAPVGVYEHRPEPSQKKRIQKLDYPVFWVEVLNPAYERWVAVDPLVTGTIARPSKLEPPASYELNSMTYVFAFDQDGRAKDVSRRYTKAFNAKTRRLRIEVTRDGQEWLKRALKPFKQHGYSDRDQIEDGELSKREAQEGLPNNIQDFKEHPIYALERHLKRNEIIWPKREVGKINAGKSSTSNLEPIFRRADVQVVQSADKWYRAGREIKTKEQPMKHVPARARRMRPIGEEDDDEPEMTALYAYSQTEPYIPPPVFRGKVPKNAYGNIDIYVPSMVPAGGVHIKHAMSKKAALLLGIDFADAVTGFQFKGRHGTAIVQGVVVALENKDAMESIILGFHEAIQQEEDNTRSLECLRLWRRFLLGLQIAERIGLTDIYAANDEKQEEFKNELAEAEEDRQEAFEAGGFFPDGGADEVVQPTGHLFEKTAPQGSGLAKARAHSPQPPTSSRDLRSRSGQQRKRLLDESDDDQTYTPESAMNRPSEKKEPTMADVNSLEGGSMQQTGYESSPKQSMPIYSESLAADESGGGFMISDTDSQPRTSHVPHTETASPTGYPSSQRADEDDIDDNPKSVEPSEAAESDYDHGSLLSHDPEDEDADPEWLDPN